MKKTVIPIFFSVDDNYAACLSVTMASLMMNASKDYDYRLIVMYEKLTGKNMVRLGALARDNFQVEFVCMKEKLELLQSLFPEENIGAMKDNNLLRCDYHTMTIYFRLFIPELFREYVKCIYLDCDTVVNGDISMLYGNDLKGNAIGACRDNSIRKEVTFQKYIENAVGVPYENYVNSGVLLMDLTKLRKMKFAGKVLHLMSTKHFDTIAPDQDYLNAVLAGNIHFLDKLWNVMPGGLEEKCAYPMIIHFNLFEKPWNYEGVEYEEYFWKYASYSGFLEDLKAHLSEYDAVKRISDAECFRQMNERAEQIIKDGKRFADEAEIVRI